MAPPKHATERYTYGEYLHWPDDVRYELIDGQAWRMAPAPTVEHQTVAGEIFANAPMLWKARLVRCSSPPSMCACPAATRPTTT